MTATARCCAAGCPAGRNSFEQEIILANCQQLGPTLVVEDVNGKRAVSMAFWNRNLNMEEFICSDRCNFLGNARLKTRAGEQTWTQVSFRAEHGHHPSKGLLHMAAAPRQQSHHELPYAAH